MNKKLRIAILTMSIHGIMSSCSADQDANSPGLCALKCSGAKIAGNDARFRVVSGTGSIECTGVQIPSGKVAVEALGPITVQFIAESVRKLTYSNPLDREAANRQSTVDDSAGKLWTPLAGIAFEPIIFAGLMAGEKTATENATVGADGTVSPFKYAGIVTPSTEWCTDSCGVASVEIWPLCVQDIDNEISVGIHSGALYAPELKLTLAGYKAAALRSDSKGENTDQNSSRRGDTVNP